MKYLTSKRQAIVRSMLHTYNLDIGSGNVPITPESTIADININGINAADMSIFSDEKFDSITALEVFEHLDMTTLLCTMHEIYRVLKHGGQLIISIPNYRWYMREFQNVTWFIRRHTTLRSYKGNGHINMQPPQHIESLLLHYGFEIMETRRVYLYDIIIRAIKT